MLRPSSRRILGLFTLLATGGSYAIFKSRTLAMKSTQRADGDYTVHPSRSGIYPFVLFLSVLPSIFWGIFSNPTFYISFGKIAS
jgi:hypothetical protein